MVAVDFGHTSNPDKTGFGSNQRLLNAYPEALGDAAKSPLPVYAVPGTSRFDTGATGLNGPCRGMLYVFGKGLYVIAGTAAALFDDQGNATPVSGTIGGSSMAIMAANQRPNPQIGIVADNVYYVLDTGTNTIAEPNISTLPAPNSVTFLDGYLVFSIPDGRIFHTNLNDALTVNALAYGTASSRSDGLRRIVTHRGALIALGETSLEIWEDVGTMPFAFAPIRADVDIGCIAEQTVTTVADALLWADQNGMVRQLTASEPVRISTHALERAISDLSWDERRALRAVYTHFNGHDFYALTSPYWTWEFDLATGLWHERASGGLPNWFAQGYRVVQRQGGDRIERGCEPSRPRRFLANREREPLPVPRTVGPAACVSKGFDRGSAGRRYYSGCGNNRAECRSGESRTHARLVRRWRQDVERRTHCFPWPRRGAHGGRKLPSARRDAKGRADFPALLVFAGLARHPQRRRTGEADTRMTGQANLFSRFGFQVGPDGKLDNYTRAFFSKFGGRVGPAIADVDANSSWAQIAATSNGLISEFAAQGWTQKGYDADETAYANAIQAVTMIPAATEWGYAPYEVFQDRDGNRC